MWPRVRQSSKRADKGGLHVQESRGTQCDGQSEQGNGWECAQELCGLCHPRHLAEGMNGPREGKQLLGECISVCQGLASFRLLTPENNPPFFSDEEIIINTGPRIPKPYQMFSPKCLSGHLRFHVANGEVLTALLPSATFTATCFSLLVVPCEGSYMARGYLMPSLYPLILQILIKSQALF